MLEQSAGRIGRRGLIGGALSMAVAMPSLAAPSKPSARILLTTADQALRLSEQGPAAIGAVPRRPDLVLDSGRTHQRMEGFGASLTESACWAIGQLPWEAQERLLRQLFDPTAGIGLSILRQPVGASDFALSSYTYYDRRDAGVAAMLNFTLERERRHVLPMLRRALAINPAITVVGSPWSPPAWMKSGGSLNGGRLLPEHYGTYADYLVRYVQAMAAEGVAVSALTVQNEPRHETNSYPSMAMDAPEQARFLAQHLGPALAAAGLRTRVLVWDHNWDGVDFPMTVLADPAARPFVAGVAFHDYAGDPALVRPLRQAHPQVPLWLTEITAGAWSPGFAGNLRYDVTRLLIRAVREGVGAVVKWNAALDQGHGPKNGGCQICDGLVTVDTGTGAVIHNYDYFALGHASRFVRPGFTRIEATPADAGAVDGTAFLGPDGQRVLVAFNTGAADRTVGVQDGARGFRAWMPAGSAATFVWR
ncbi:MAG TPA: glycoside hydrolase family 30 beta sandwich domain-containing protein [Azospirillaceae bacterium]|nr:glycoside hydrolase family 30 beta sandwich domain-containing protein [Azospirillaceae bacterium]